MTNDAERVSDIVAKLRALPKKWGFEEEGGPSHGRLQVADEAADIIEAQSKALAEALESAPVAVKPGKWHDAGYLMSIIDAAIEDGFDPDEDGPLLDEIRAELKEPIRASDAGKAVAWMHTLHMEFDQTAVRLARAEIDRPWGKPGMDFSDEYTVTITPLYAAPVSKRVERLETALTLAHEEIVLVIAFLGRDIGTARERSTIDGLSNRLVDADAAIRQALQGGRS